MKHSSLDFSLATSHPFLNTHLSLWILFLSASVLDEELQKILSWTTISKEMSPSHPEPTTDSPQPSTTTAAAAGSQTPKITAYIDENVSVVPDEEVELLLSLLD